tara:strand:- start:57 stop:623 length:567 start_codon:yes stop_codon:yes gene_type:complete
MAQRIYGGIEQLVARKAHNLEVDGSNPSPATKLNIITMRILNNGEYKYTWQQEKQMLSDSFARALLVEHNIKEVTTQRQAKNGTREFEFPVPARTVYLKGILTPSKDRLRLAVYKTGYVRNCNSCSSNYQLNKQYKQEQRTTFLIDGKLETRKYQGYARALVWDELARLNYMLEYYLKNYNINTNTVG